MTTQEAELQQKYYSETAHKYNKMHVQEGDEHFFALSFMAGMLEYLGVRTILDIGSGTGRALSYIKARHPGVGIVGIEPVKELREVGYSHGLSNTELIEGDAARLQFSDKQFDVVCEFGVLHHVRRPERVVSEMLRVANKAVFISDSNNFGQGTRIARAIKQALRSCGVWRVADYIKTHGRGYTVSEGDGVAYSYSVFNSYRQVREACSSAHIVNTKDGEINPYRTAGHVALLGIKKS